MRLNDVGVQYDGVDCLKHCYRKRAYRLGAVGALAESVASYFAFEHVDVSFSAEKNYLLLNDSHAFKLLRITRTEAGFKLYFYKNLYEELIKAAIEGNVVDIYA